MPTFAAKILPETGERRAVPRDDVRYDAQSFVKDRPDAMPCVVLNVSAAGARIRLPDFLSFLPKNSKLYIEEKHMLAECEQVWRNGNEIGVKFTSIVAID